MSACANEDSVVFTENVSVESCNSIRNTDEAVSIAQNLVAALNSGSRSHYKSVEVAGVDVLCGFSSRSDNDTLLYAVNLADNGGYVLVSASYATEPVIGYVESGCFDLHVAEETPGFNYYLAQAKEYVSSAGTIGVVPTPPSYTYTKMVLPRIVTEFGQRYPEGYFCPNKVSGCVQTAMAQILTYIKKPTVLNLTYPERDKSMITLDWDNITEHITSANATTDLQIQRHLALCLASEEAHLDLARMCREFGFRNGAEYYTSSTGASSVVAKSTLISLLPNNQISETISFTANCNLFNELLIGDCVAYVRGVDSSAGGHAWVCDGGDAVVLVSYAMLNDGTMEKRETPTYYYHFNWGWNGVSNGYFLSGVFDSDKPSISRYNFNNSTSYFLVYK